MEVSISRLCKTKVDGVQQGIMTVILGILVPFCLADTPERATRWLSERERRYLKARMTLQDGGKKMQEAGSHFSWALLWAVFSDWQFYIMIFNYWSNNIPQYGMKFTMPQIMVRPTQFWPPQSSKALSESAQSCFW